MTREEVKNLLDMYRICPKYLDGAFRRSIEKHQDIMEAYVKGAEIEFRELSGGVDRYNHTPSPEFFDFITYRVAPNRITVFGVEIEGVDPPLTKGDWHTTSDTGAYTLALSTELGYSFSKIKYKSMHSFIAGLVWSKEEDIRKVVSALRNKRKEELCVQ